MADAEINVHQAQREDVNMADTEIKVIRVRLFKAAKDWHYQKEILYQVTHTGDVIMEDLKTQLGCHGHNIQVHLFSGCSECNT